MTTGTYLRAKARLNVIRGYPGNETVGLTFSALPKTGEAILSGMIISIDVNGQWIKGVPAGKKPYFAWHDQTDTDVVSSGLLLGLSCAASLELETGYADFNQTYVQDSPIKADSGTAGSVTLTTLSGGADIIGFATHGGRQDTTKTNSEGGTVAGPNYALSLTTNWKPIHT